MDRATQIDMVERVLALLEARTTQMGEGGEVPAARYVDEAELERERAMIRRMPLPLAHASQLARQGDFVTCSAAGVPALLTRGGAGTRALLNVCRHRGTRVECGAVGEGKRAFVCPYHGWTYDLDGTLLHVPHEDGFPGLDRASAGLAPLRCEVRHGFVWVTAAGAGRGAEEHLGEVDAQLAALELDHHVLYSPVTYRKPLNWKLAIEIFLEAYHVKRTHMKSIYPMFFDNLGLSDAFGPHIRGYFPKRTIADLRGTDRAGWSARDHGNVLYFIFPCTLMLVQSDHVNVFNMLPSGAGETDVTGFTLIPELPRTEKARRYWDKNIEILLNATDEDFAMGASIQQGLDAGASHAFRFGRFEQAIGWFHAALQAAIAQG